jgi:hypothetical protein
MAAWFLVQEFRIARQWGFPLDDSWIYATIARNLATGHGYSFNPGEINSGATGPLYVFILAFFYLIFHAVIWPAKAFGIACLCASALLTYEAAKRLLPVAGRLPLLAGLLVALSPLLIWGSLSGLEQPVYLLVACLVLRFLASARWTAATLASAAGIWLRPDGIFLVPLALLARGKAPIRSFLAPAFAAAAIVGAYFAFNYAVGDWILPTSVAVKSHFGSDLLGREGSMAIQWIWLWGLPPRPQTICPHAPILLPAMILGCIVGFRKWPLAAVYLFGFPAVFALFGPNGGQHGRYIAYVIPFGVLLACIGIREAAARVPRGNMLLFAFGAACILWQVNFGRIFGTTFGLNIQNINRMHRYIGEVARKSTAPGDTIAVNDVGAIGYFSGCYIVDLVGLESPTRTFPENLRRYKPKYLIIFPDWYEQYVARDPQTHQAVFYDPDSVFKWAPFASVELKENTIASRKMMVAFVRIPKSQPASQRIRLISH